MKKTTRLITLTLILISSMISCNQEQISQNNDQNQHPKLSGIYLGQKLPGLIPEVFAPDILSTQYHNNSAPTISADMNEIYWSLSFMQGVPEVILFMKRENNQWTEPKVASFSGLYSDGAPFFSPDGQKLFFHSNRPMDNKGEPKDNDIWYAERTASGWSDAINAGTMVNTEKFESYPSFSNKGNLFFNSYLEGYAYNIGIYKSQLVNGVFSKRLALDEQINSKKGFNWCPYIDPDERYLLFSSGRDGQEYDDIYCSFKRNDGSWSEPIEMGDTVNTDLNDRFPSVSPDGKYLFISKSKTDFKPYFQSPQSYHQLLERYNNMHDDIYWVDAKVIEDLKPEYLK